MPTGLQAKMLCLILFKSAACVPSLCSLYWAPLCSSHKSAFCLMPPCYYTATPVEKLIRFCLKKQAIFVLGDIEGVDVSMQEGSAGWMSGLWVSPSTSPSSAQGRGY